MKLAGFTRNSFVDYPGRIAAVAFLAGCNYDCFFCHNRSIISAGSPEIPEEPVWDFLEKRRGLLDAVVITGGEPTLQPDLLAFIGRIKAMGYLCKLDTNGSRPDVVRALLQQRLLDYVAMDVKAPWGRYREYCGDGADPAAVFETLALLRAASLPWECRTTFLPQLTVADIEQIALSIQPVRRYALQAYRVPPSYKPTDRFRVLAAGHSTEEIRAAVEAAKVCGGEVLLRA